MSQQHVELVRRIYSDGLFDRDPDRNVHEFASPDVEYINPPEAVEPGISRGRAQVAQALRSSSELFDSRRHEAHGLFDRGDAVVAAVSFCARLLGAGPNSSRRPIPGPSATGGLRALSGGARLASALETVRLRERRCR
jgi:ketosteroid isomerase-like protein